MGEATEGTAEAGIGAGAGAEAAASRRSLRNGPTSHPCRRTRLARRRPPPPEWVLQLLHPLPPGPGQVQAQAQAQAQVVVQG